MNKQRRILVSWYTNPAYIPPFVLSDHQVTLGPQLHPAQPQMMFSAWSPKGAYDLKAALEVAAMPKNYDAVVVWTDAWGANQPLNLEAFDCPTVLCVGDTHHMQTPLRKVLDYASKTRFDYVLCGYNRQHLHWFADAGYANLAWLPGLPVQHIPRPFVSSRKSQLCFVGSFHDHPRRHHLLVELDRQSVPLVTMRASREDSADLYASSAVSFNASLNGDLNLRVFEILSAGGCLMTDRLSPGAGLDLLLAEGKEFLGYDTVEECVTQARFLLAHPGAALAIAEAGNRAYTASMLPERRANELLSWIFDGRLDSLFRPAVAASSANRADLNDRIRVYEELQELHRVRQARVLFSDDVPEIYISDALDLRQLVICLGDFGNRVVPERPAEISQRCATVSRAQMEAIVWDCIITPAQTTVPPSVRFRQLITAHTSI